MKWTPPKSGLIAAWGYTQLVLVVCMFFWFGPLAGLVGILLLIQVTS